MLIVQNPMEPVSQLTLSSIRTISSLVIVVIPLLLSTPPLRPARKLFSRLIPDLVPLDTLIPAHPPSREEKAEIRRNGLATWRQLLLVSLGLIEVAGWMTITGAEIVSNPTDLGVKAILLDAGMVLVWLFLAVRPIIRPSATPQWSSFAVYVLLWTLSIINVGIVLYVHGGTGERPHWATTLRIVLEVVNFVITTILVSIVGTLRLVSPVTLARLPSVAPDDEVTTFSWLTFVWVNPFINLGNSKELDTEDLPTLSLSLQTAINFERLRQMTTKKLLWKILLAHRLDLVMDAILTLISVVFNYAGPYFLKKILEGLTLATPEAMSKAYMFAIFAFLSSSFKAVSDLLHLWHGRRVTVRIKAELTAAVYDKALRRKDASGVVAEKEKEGEEDKDGSKEKEEKKSNADTGKIVNLMASDSNRIGNTIAGAYYIYGAPFEIAVASLFLYDILGWSAFAGVVVLIIAAPLNSWFSSRSVKITQELLKCRDKRISVMTELIGAIQFIKFFAWIEQWKARAAEARKKEMQSMVRSLINNLGFALLWNLAPICVTLVSFFCFIVIAKQELTVSVAFTAISLFSMLRMPLNVIPIYVVIILQSLVSIKRIEDFLNEDEVPDWVSSLKRSPDARITGASRIGFESATLRWNSGKQSDPATATNGTGTAPAVPTIVPPSPTASEDTTAVDTGSPDQNVFNLSNLNVDFPIAKLSVVTGPTGSGKTAILIALLGEMELLEGKSFLPKNPSSVDAETGLRNSVAYAAQTPWLQQKSIKDNILFGEELDAERYEATLEACALTPDLDVLEDGDMTEIGAKGVSLSGGQKARVALARAVYSYTQHVLLDDPLAAVDSHTAKHLTDKCLNGPLLQGRTVILVSHHVELLLPSADYLIRILDGRIDAKGTPAELRAAGELEGLIALEEAAVTKTEPVVTSEEVESEMTTVVGDAEGDKKAEKKKGPGKKLIQDEERPIGNVKWATYKLYIVAATYITWTIALLILILLQVLTVGERYWLKIWGEAYNTQLQSILAFARPFMMWTTEQHNMDVHQHFFHHAPMLAGNATAIVDSITVETAKPGFLKHLPSAQSQPGFYLTIYAGIVLLNSFMGVVSNAVSSWGQYRAAINIHDRLLNVVMRGTIRFFTVTPVGRIINRFSRDIETIDSSLNGSLQTVIAYGGSLLGAVIVVAVIVPWFLLPAAIISYLYWQYSILYLRVGRSLRRLEATLRSPIYSGFGEVLDGVVSVRAFSVEARFLKQLCEAVDKTHSAFYYYWMMNRWLLLRFDVLGALSVFFTTLFALSGAIAAGSAGIAITSAQGFVSACYWVSRFWGQLEMDFNAVERVQEYLQIPQEPPSTINGHKPPAYWPSSDSGDSFLSVRDVEIKYAPDLPTVFQGSFDVKAGEKIGLIGRTGSGKSTLAMSMLRFADPASGKIVLDGIDITSIGVDDLRSRITYIPQDAVLFSGTVRENLDPFDEHSEEELLDALARVNLGPSETPAPSHAPSRQPSSHRLAAIAAEESGRPSSISGSTRSSTKITITLTTEVSSGGSNFSQGQRQLVAMARALLRRSNLIIMDEATASVDFATDEAIQRAIRSEFKSSTLLTIAHRLSSVIDYDRLLVLDNGKVAEFDTPINLLRKEGSLFKNLCEKSGKYRELFKAAEQKEKNEEAWAMLGARK